MQLLLSPASKVSKKKFRQPCVLPSLAVHVHRNVYIHDDYAMHGDLRLADLSPATGCDIPHAVYICPTSRLIALSLMIVHYS